MLHQFGINHERFTVKFQGLDAKLSGVEPAKVVNVRMYLKCVQRIAVDEADVSLLTIMVTYYHSAPSSTQPVWCNVSAIDYVKVRTVHISQATTRP
jgi:hypothetical protein